MNGKVKPPLSKFETKQKLLELGCSQAKAWEQERKPQSGEISVAQSVSFGNYEKINQSPVGVIFKEIYQLIL